MLNKVNHYFGKVRAMIAGPFQGLRDQQHRNPVFRAGAGAVLEMFVEKLGAQLIELGVAFKNSPGALC